MTLAADYYDGKSTRRHAVCLSLDDDLLRVNGEGIERVAALADLRVSEPMGEAPRLVTFPDGAYCEIRDHAGLQTLLHATGFEDHFVVRWQFSLRWIAVSAVLCLAVLLAGYRWGLPWLSEQVAAELPDSVLQSVGDRVLASLDERLLVPSEIPAARQEALAERFAALRVPDGVSLNHRVVFRAARGKFVNAIALPSGTIIVTDSLFALAKSDNELMGVLAHELGHVKERHGMRLVVQGTVVGVLAAWFLGDVSSIAAAAPAALMEASYSRGFEREADAFAARMLAENGISPRCLGDLLQRLDDVAKHENNNDRGASAGYLASHPATGERLMELRGASCD